MRTRCPSLTVTSVMVPATLLARVLAVLDRFPPADTPGQQAGRVSFAFVSPDNEESWIWFSVTDGVRARENGRTGSALLVALRSQQDAGLEAVPEAEVTSQALSSDLDACKAYLDLAVSFSGGEGQAVVSSYQCVGAHVDFTGQSPGPVLGPVPVSSPLRLQFGAEVPPESVEVRFYPGAGVSASFFRWPEDLPKGVEPVAACAMTMVTPLTDDPDMRDTLNAAVQTFFG
mgnify:CR=1 FL=1